jgi:hypothetical protein
MKGLIPGKQGLEGQAQRNPLSGKKGRGGSGAGILDNERRGKYFKVNLSVIQAGLDLLFDLLEQYTSENDPCPNQKQNNDAKNNQ